MKENTQAYPTSRAEDLGIVTQGTNYASEILNVTLPDLLNKLSINGVDLDGLRFTDVKFYF